MSRKAVLEGGKRDEIIFAAMQLFFEKGYEATSVRMILDKVDGEVGMFYHYFKSKDELFQMVTERFFRDYQQSFTELVDKCDSVEQFITAMIPHYNESMSKYYKLSGSMHWTIQYAMATRTIDELRPVIVRLIDRLGCGRKEPPDIVAGQLLYAISATLHSKSFKEMPEDERIREIRQLIPRMLRE